MIHQISDRALGAVATASAGSRNAAAVAAWDDRVYVVDILTHEVLWKRRFKGAREVAFCGSTSLLVATNSGALFLLDLTAGRRRFKARIEPWVSALVTDSAGCCAVLGTENGVVEARNVSNGGPVASAQMSSKATRMATCPDVVLVGTQNGEVVVLDHALKARASLSFGGPITALAASGKDILVVANSTVFVGKWDGRILSARAVRKAVPVGYAVALAPGYWAVSSWKQDGPASLFVIDSRGRAITECRTHPQLPIFDLAVTGRTVLAASMTGELVLWRPTFNATSRS